MTEIRKKNYVYTLEAKVMTFSVQKHEGSKQVGFKQLGYKQVGFKQLGPSVKTGVHGVINVFGLRWNCRELKGIVKLRFFRLVTMMLQWLKDGWRTSNLKKRQRLLGLQQQNGLVKETNVTLLAKAHCFLIQSGLSKVLWAEDTTMSTYLVNKGCWNRLRSNAYSWDTVKGIVGMGSMQVLQGDEFEVEPQDGHTFEGATLCMGTIQYREDSNKTAFVVAALGKIYAHESLTFNNTVACEVISMWKAGLKDDMDARS
ncbi:hypothetical protein Tco_1251920, partial [Tanacetum coccineum]